jgi:magnesium transporter
MTEVQGPLTPTLFAELIKARRWFTLGHLLAEIHPADCAEMMASLSPDEEIIVIRLMSKRMGEVFAYLKPQQQRRLIRSVSPEQLALMVGQMRPDDRTRVLGILPLDVAHALQGRLPPSEVKQSLALLSYPKAAAGRYMTPNYAAIRPDMTAAEALLEIRRTGRGKETLNVVYIVDELGRLLEDVRLGSLVLADPATKVTDIPDPGLVSLLDSTPLAEVRQTFEKYDRVALPVVDSSRLLLGIITMDDILDVAEAANTRDIQKLGGLEALDIPYAETGFWSMVRKRGGWLAALFLGEMFTATAMGHYEAEIARAVVLALFVPLIISIGGNSGSQATSLIIRSLALRELNLRDWPRIFRRELLPGLALGSALGAIGFTRVVLWQHFKFTSYGEHYLLVAGTIWLSLVGVVTFGTLAGSMLPFLLRRLGFDPATSSAPFVTTLVDVTGLVIYFQVASLILRGTVL